MKAIQLEQFGIEHLHLRDIPAPIPAGNEVLVRTTAVALEFHDLLVVENRIPFGIQLPHVPVSEGVGIVEEVGAQVTRWKKGDRVLIPFIGRWEAGRNTPYHDQWRTAFSRPGLLSEFTVQPENTLVRTPATLTDAEAAPLPVGGLTVWTILVEQAQIRAGQTILIQGSGGVSLFALQIAKLFGLKVIATTGSKEKEQKLKKLGADEVINYKEFPEWSKEVKRINGGIGVDVTLDVAGTDTIEQSILSVKQHGFVGLIGLMTGTRLSIDLIPLITNYVRLQAYSVGNAEELSDFVQAIEKNHFKPVIDSVYPLDQVQEAFHRFKSGKAFGKVVITF
ncbi:NAD(P)-dependent alcohol dehydrogenase [Paraflavitalea sp. CAU 1676]|uniref:zinc-dependent alcohol dehydrogenase family protein n=1 Tax=Paraflavitalea sp. CAU 1676 TaxID=3032598 RepID=UPI0023DB3C26|nr:NAD(P)-dependent alcohol dehydrogenase [Paraflavitalea sp. CAU 1676]MDF2186804.1 NAD(P)-dependent alcohol dehydrogenase [Paraflavitalea sp. CAU 1676]